MTEAGSFDLFGTAHVLAMLLIAAACVLLPPAVRRAQSLQLEGRVAAIIAVVLLLHEFSKIATRVWLYEMPVEEQLPLHLCAVTLFLVAFLLVRRNYSAFEVAYFWAMGGTVQAILTPDLEAGFPSYAFTIFFFGHGLVMLGVAYAVIVFRFKPTLRSIGKALLATVAYAAAVAPVNWLLGTNYLYLRHKPQGASIIDYLGPWPWYIASLGLLTVVLCLFWWLPFGVASRYTANRAMRDG